MERELFKLSVLDPNSITQDVLRVVGDVHGDSVALAGAVSDHAFHAFLGDLVDRGPNSPECVTRVSSMIDSGRAALVRSNHGWKLARHFMGNPVNLGPDQLDTIDQIKRSGDPSVSGKLLRDETSAPYAMSVGCMTFAHAAVDNMVFSGKASKSSHARCIYGTTDGYTESGLPRRTFDWHDEVPSDTLVVVGHHVLSKSNPVMTQTKSGSFVVYLDTGCGSGGPLSYLDFALEDCTNFERVVSSAERECEFVSEAKLEELYRG